MSDDDHNGYESRYATARILLESGDIDTFKTLFQIIPKEPILELLEMNERELKDRIEDPGLFQIGHYVRISELLNVDMEILVEVARNSRKR
jgi:hypothetical protein